MRLINTETFELDEFMGAVPKYAILSHTWGEGEVSFQDWQRVRQDERWQPLGRSSKFKVQGSAQRVPIYHTPPTDNSSFDDCLEAFNSRGPKAGFWKILKACFQARGDGLRYLWADTNCIDKSSSAELSEAINSMYAWYRQSSVCYAFLADVPLATHETLHDPGSQFRRSRWFTRGWTLQELIAPTDTVFFSADWTKLGTKNTLSPLLADITGIQEKYLLKLEGIHGASIAQRFSWASNRITTRPEDIAYCLLGMFDVNLPMIYGEGSKAFNRLQEEIIKTSADHSVFAWTWIPELTYSAVKAAGDFEQPSRTSSNHSTLLRPGPNAPYPFARLAALRDRLLWTNAERPTLLAPDPCAFFNSGFVPALSPSETDTSAFALTNAGMSIDLATIEQGGSDLVFAVIHQAQDKRKQPEEQVLICVPLTPHGQGVNRYVRACFPRGPITVVRKGSQYPPARGWVTPQPRTIQVCRDVQQVPFYYRGFGGLGYEYGYWFFLPRGWKGWRLVGGYATNGVLNEYGIFSDPDSEGVPVAGGIVVFRAPDGKAVGILLAQGPSISEEEPAHHLVKVFPVDCSQIVLNSSSGNVADDRPFGSRRKELDQLFREELAGLTPESRGTSTKAGFCAVWLHNSAALSHSQTAGITITELDFA